MISTLETTKKDEGKKIFLTYAVEKKKFDKFIQSAETASGQILPEEKSVKKTLDTLATAKDTRNWMVLAMLPTSIIDGTIVHGLLHAEFLSNSKYRSGIESFFKERAREDDIVEYRKWIEAWFKVKSDAIIVDELQSVSLSGLFLSTS